MMRERFDRLEVIDLRGDLRRGERAGVVADQGVFDIQVGIAITVAVADGSKRDGEAAEVGYQDTWTEGLFLGSRSSTGLTVERRKGASQIWSWWNAIRSKACGRSRFRMVTG